MKAIKSEPVFAAMTATAILSYVASFLVLHGVITSTQATATVQETVPGVTAVVIFLIGLVIRSVVTPALSEVEKYAGKWAPGLAPAIDRGVAEAEQWITQWTAPTTLTVPAGTTQTVLLSSPVHPLPDGSGAANAAPVGPSDPPPILSSPADGPQPMQAG